MKRRPSRLEIAAAGLWLLSGQALGQDAGIEVDLPTASADESPPPQAEARQALLEEIVVTAQKREERLQDVPISITAFSGDELAASGVKSTTDLAIKTPGLVFDSLVNYAIIYIRGVGTDVFLPSVDVSVAPYIDGVYFPITFGLARSIGEVERIEVLKGPQGTLFGRNSTGGAISIVTRAPSREWSGSLSTYVGSYGETNHRAYLSGPITNTLSVGVSAIYNLRDDYYDTVAPSERGDLQRGQDVGANVKLRWEPADAFSATLSGFYFDTRGAGTALTPCQEASRLGELLNVRCAPDYDTNHDARIGSFNRFYAGIANLEWSPDLVTVKSISGYQRNKGGAQNDFDGSNANLVAFHTEKGDRGLYGRIFSQELQILSNEGTPGSDYLRWILGFYVYNSTTGIDPLYVDMAGLANGIGGLASGSLPLPVEIPLLDQIADLTSGLDVGSLRLGVHGSLRTRAYAAYTQLTLTPWERLDVTVGGRWNKERRALFDSGVDADGTLLGADYTAPFTRFDDARLKDTDFSPKANVAFRLADDKMVYASWQKGYKSGSYNIVNITAAPTRIKPEIVTTIEVGAKTQWFSGTLQVNGALFHNEMKDLQVQFLSLLSGGVVQIENAPEASSRGAEVDIVWAATPDLRLNLGATLLRSRYERFDDASGYDEQGFFTSRIDATGNRITRNPRLTTSTGFSYAPWGRNSAHSVELGADWYHSSGYYFTSQNSISQPAYDVVNARIAYSIDPWDLRLTLFGANLTDSRRYLSLTQNDLAVIGKLAMPRTFGLSVAWSF